MTQERRRRRSRRTTRTDRTADRAPAGADLPHCEHCKGVIFPGEEATIIRKAVISIGERTGTRYDEYLEMENGTEELWYHSGCQEDLILMEAHDLLDDMEQGLMVCPSCGTHVTECNHCGEDLTNYYEVPC